MLEGKSKLRYHKSNFYVSIPHCVGSDSAFPFGNEEEVGIRIEGKIVILYKKN